MKFKDFRCKCGVEAIDVIEVDGDISVPRHCGKKMSLVPGGPMVFFKPHYSHALGKKVQRYSDEEKELASKGQWIASKTEANRLYDTDHFTDNVTVQPAEKEAIRKTAEKAAAKLAKDGLMSPRP
jgi:hypothetical protein